jgi:hypothetical protein
VYSGYRILFPGVKRLGVALTTHFSLPTRLKKEQSFLGLYDLFQGELSSIARYLGEMLEGVCLCWPDVSPDLNSSVFLIITRRKVNLFLDSLTLEDGTDR